MAKLEFTINVDNASTVKDVKSSVTLNGKEIDSSTVSVYKVEEEDFNCNYLTDLTSLSDDYVINNNETYGVYVKDFNYAGTGVTFQSEEEVSVNGLYVEDYDCFSFGTQSTKENVNSMRIVMKKAGDEIKEEIYTTGEDVKEVVKEEPPVTNNNETPMTTYIFIGVALVLVIIGTIALMKLNKKRTVK